VGDVAVDVGDGDEVLGVGLGVGDAVLGVGLGVGDEVLGVGEGVGDLVGEGVGVADWAGWVGTTRLGVCTG
jgi:hypothetical protein